MLSPKEKGKITPHARHELARENMVHHPGGKNEMRQG
jgi:hypothetical protein